MARVIGRLALAVVYYVVVTPVAIARRLVAGNPLRHPAGDLGYWLPHESARPGADDMRRPS